jgi:hypothetical protein
MLFARMYQFIALGEVLRIGKCRYGSAARNVNSVATAMIPVQMRIDYDADRFRLESVTGERLDGMHTPRHPHAIERPFIVPHTAAGFD